MGVVFLYAAQQRNIVKWVAPMHTLKIRQIAEKKPLWLAACEPPINSDYIVSSVQHIDPGAWHTAFQLCT